MRFEEVSLFDTRSNLDRGPDETFKHCVEVKTVDKIMTLFSHDGQLVSQFTYYLQRVIELRDQINAQQKISDDQISEMYKQFGKSQTLKVQNSLSRSRIKF